MAADASDSHWPAIKKKHWILVSWGYSSWTYSSVHCHEKYILLTGLYTLIKSCFVTFCLGYLTYFFFSSLCCSCDTLFVSMWAHTHTHTHTHTQIKQSRDQELGLLLRRAGLTAVTCQRRGQQLIGQFGEGGQLYCCVSPHQTPFQPVALTTVSQQLIGADSGRFRASVVLTQQRCSLKVNALRGADDVL